MQFTRRQWIHPLSPFLFVLAADAFTRMLQLAEEAYLIQGLSPDYLSPKVLCLQYANDSIVFCQLDTKQLC